MVRGADRQRAVLLDLDDTLLQWERGLQSSVRDTAAAFEGRGYGVDEDLLKENLIRSIERTWQASSVIENPYGADESEWHQIWEETLVAVGLHGNITPDYATTFFLNRVRQSHALFPEVVPVLKELACCFRLAVVTNGGSAWQHEKIEVTGLEQYFDAIVVSGDMGIKKPDSRIFERTLSLLGVPHDQAVHVGDSLQADVAGAHATGITAIWVNRSGVPIPDGYVQPDHLIGSLVELPALLKRLDC